MKRLVLAGLFLAAPLLAASSLKLEDGRYRLIATVEHCKASLCAVIDKSGRDELQVALEASDWDKSLASITGLKLVLTGKIKSMRLKLEEAPKVFHDSVDDLLSPPSPIKRI